METAATPDKVKKPPNTDVGEVTCPFCADTAPVRRNAKDKLYFNCRNCGIVQPLLPSFQSWLVEHATLYGADKPERAAPKRPEPEPDTREAPAVISAPSEPAAPTLAPVRASKPFRIFR